MNQIFDALPELFVLLFEHVIEELGHFNTWPGAWAELMEFSVLYPAAMALLWIVFSFLFVLRREWRLPFNPAFKPSIAVVVPAHNEELVITRTIEGLLEQTYPNMQIHIVSDGSIDATVEIARRYQDRGVIVHDLKPNRGKSKALQHALEYIDTDLFMVVDADTVADPDAIGTIVQQFMDLHVGAVTGHPRVRNVVNLLTAIQAMEYAVIVSLAKRAEQFWGGLYTVSGAAACFRTQALRQVGGWSEKTATEDIEISWRLQKAGWLLAYEPRALFRVQAPVGLGALYRQRRRWAQGMVEVLRLHWNLAFTDNAALIPIAIQVLATALWMLLMTAFLLQTALSVLAGTFDASVLLRLTTIEWYRIFFWTFGLFALQTFTACVFDGTYERGVWRVFPLFALYPLYYWLVVYPSFLLGAIRGLRTGPAGKWKRTDRTTALALADLSSTTGSSST
jgi:biofilm PGA synthesis N-glycosyltransferase PgaC